MRMVGILDGQDSFRILHLEKQRIRLGFEEGLLGHGVVVLVLLG